MPADSFEVEPTGASDFAPCECCGHPSRCVRGFVQTAEESVAAYFVHWTPGGVADHGADFDLVIGPWGERSAVRDRVLVTLEYRLLENGPAFMVRDARDRPADRRELAGKALTRAAVIRRPIAARAFAIVDAILAQDERVAEMSG